MAYEKQNFIDNETVLKAEHLNHIEEGIIQNEKNIEKKADLDEEGKLKEEQMPENALTAEALTEAINTALTQAKESGEFDGDDGSDYVLTEEDRAEIAEQAADLVGGAGGGASSVEWEAVKNKPFYSVEAPDNVTWGGDTTGKVSTGYTSGDSMSGYTNIKYYKVSGDASMNVETFKSCTRYEKIKLASELVKREYGSVIAFTDSYGMPYVIFAPEGGGKVWEGLEDEFTIPEGGIYAMWIQQSNGNYVDNLVFDGVKPLDNQFVQKAESITEGETLPPTAQAVIDYVSGVVESFDTALSAAIGTGVLE